MDDFKKVLGVYGGVGLLSWCWCSWRCWLVKLVLGVYGGVGLLSWCWCSWRCWLVKLVLVFVEVLAC